MPNFIVAERKSPETVTVHEQAAGKVKGCKTIVFVNSRPRDVDYFVCAAIGEDPGFAGLAKAVSGSVLLGYISQDGVAFLAVSDLGQHWWCMVGVAADLATVVYAPAVSGSNTFGAYSAGMYVMLKRKFSAFERAELVVYADRSCPHSDSYTYIANDWNHDESVTVAEIEEFIGGESLHLRAKKVTFVKSLAACLLSAIVAPGAVPRAMQRAMPVVTFSDGAVRVDRVALGVIRACNHVVFVMGGAGDASEFVKKVVGEAAGHGPGSQLQAVSRSDGLFVAVAGGIAFLFAPAVAEREFGDEFWLATMRLGAYLADVVCAAAICDVGGSLTPAVYAAVFAGVCADGEGRAARTPLLVRYASPAGLGEVAGVWKGQVRQVPGFDGVAALISACGRQLFSESGISRVLGSGFNVLEDGWPRD